MLAKQIRLGTGAGFWGYIPERSNTYIALVFCFHYFVCNENSTQDATHGSGAVLYGLGVPVQAALPARGLHAGVQGCGSVGVVRGRGEAGAHRPTAVR